MKNALLVYQSYNSYFNIGDYVQSLAASQFFHDKIDLFINREHLNEYSGEQAKLIMNGWFIHESHNWPPSDSIVPLFVSFHMNSVARNELLSSESIKYLKTWQPIGCRDKETARLLVERGVDSYFSGCLTLTIGESYKSREKSEDVYFVDAYFDFEKKMVSLLKYMLVLFMNYRVVRIISRSLFGKAGIKHLIKTAAFYRDYSRSFDSVLLENAIYINHIIKDCGFGTEEDKFRYANELLQKYARARFIITSRLHCALPCLGMDTPVIYIENVNQSETSFCRLDGLREFLNIVTYDHGKMQSLFVGLNGKIGWSFSFKNKTNHIAYKEKLIARCQKFVNE
jgi:hypothetical protein